MGLIFNGNGDVIKAVDGSLTVEGIDLGGSTNINAGIATFSGNVNVGGVLTYEDVKNVDSVGVITARSGIDCNGTLEVSSTSNFDGSLQIADTILHLGDTNTKIRFPGADIFTAETGGSERLRCDGDGVKTLNGRFYSAGTFAYIESSSTSTTTLTLRKTASGADAIDYLQLRNNANDLKLKIGGDGTIYSPDVLASHEGDTDTKIRFPAADTITAETGGSERLRITSGGVTQITKGTSGGATANTDAALILDNSSHTYVQFRTPSDKEQGILFGDVQDNNVGSIAYSHSTNALSFTTNANSRLTITSGGLVTVKTGHLNLENASATTSKHYSITNAAGTTGWTFGNGVTASAHQFVIYDNTAGAARIKIDANGAVQITRRLELTNSGDNHAVHEGRAWTWTNTGLAGGTVRSYMYGNSSGDLLLGTNGWNERLRITSAGRVGINQSSPAAYCIHASHNGEGGNQRVDLHMTNATTGHNSNDGVQFGYQNTAGAYIWNYENTPIYFGTNNAERLSITSAGHLTLQGGKIYGEDNASNSLHLQSTSGNNNHSRVEIGATQSSDNGGIHFYTAGSSTATRRMTLKGTSGYLGLGVDNPENLIHTGAGNVGIARTINHAQTSNLTAQYNLSINRESNGASHGHGINKSLNVDNQYTIATFRSTLTNRNGTNQWYDIAKFIAWDFRGKIFVQSGGTFTGDQVEIDVISSYNSALNNGYSGPYLEVKRTEGHHSGRFTKVKIGCHNSNRQPIVQIYHSGNNTHNSNSWVTVTVHDYGSAYGVGSYRGEPRFQAATTLNETWKELDIDGTHMNYWNTSTTPAFSAYKADNANQISSGTYAFNSQILDRGGDNYNTSNGRFTAPCDGVYYFIATLQMYGGSGTNHARFQKNGTDVYNNGTNTPYYDEKHSSHANLQPFCLVELSTDDYVECVRSGNTRGMQSAMIGFLVR